MVAKPPALSSCRCSWRSWSCRFSLRVVCSDFKGRRYADSLIWILRAATTTMATTPVTAVCQSIRGSHLHVAFSQHLPPARDDTKRSARFPRHRLRSALIPAKFRSRVVSNSHKTVCEHVLNSRHDSPTVPNLVAKAKGIGHAITLPASRSHHRRRASAYTRGQVRTLVIPATTSDQTEPSAIRGDSATTSPVASRARCRIRSVA